MLQFSTDIGTLIGKTCKCLYTTQDSRFLQLTQPGSVTIINSRSSNKPNHTMMMFQTENFTFKCMSFFLRWIQWPLFPLTPRVSIHYAVSIKVLVHWKLFLPEEPIVWRYTSLLLLEFTIRGVWKKSLKSTNKRGENGPGYSYSYYLLNTLYGEPRN